MDNGLIQQLRQMQAGFQLAERNDYAHRKHQLLKLKKALLDNEPLLYDALQSDLKKNKEESWVTELGFVIAEINHALRQLKRWMRPVKASTNLLNLPSKSYIIREPLGTVLIIGPWNYPVQLTITPLIGALAAGNKIVLKPSEHAPATAAAIEKIIAEAFDVTEILVVQGDGAELIPYMMTHFRFDYVFYTGSHHVGKRVYEMAASQLVPITLELGGKSPCIIEKDANIKVTAKRIALAKFSNAGQMCVAPDYLVVHESVKDKLLNELKLWIFKFYASEDVKDYHYGKIINEKQFRRLVKYIDAGTLFHGGESNPDELHIEPTVLVDVSPDDDVMKDEIFGPILPVITWKEDEEVYKIIGRNPEPLSLYVFTESDEKAKKWTTTIPFGGACINNTSWHLTNYHLPFGGVGKSGFGRYHGKYSFETFSHTKAIMKTPTWFDPSIRYPPFKGKLNLFKKIIR